MSREIVEDSQQNFAGGVNSTASEFAVGATQVRQAENTLLTQYGDIIRRGGSQRTSAAAIAAAPVRNGFCWKTASTHEYLVACNGTLYSGGTFAIPMTWTGKGAIGSASNYVGFEAFRDGAAEVAYIADGIQLRKYLAGAQALVAGTPALSVLAVYNQRLYGVTGNDQTIHYSSLNNGDSCGVTSATSGSAIVRTFSNQKITSLLTLKGALAMFHVGGVSRFVGLTQDDLAIASGAEGISTDTGTLAPRSTVAAEGIGYFLSERGAFRVTDGGVEALDRPEFPDPIAPILPQLSASALAQVDVVHDKLGKTVRWYIPDIGIYVYHYRLNSWSGPHSGVYASTPSHCLFDGIDPNGRPVILAGGSDGYVRLMDDSTSYLDDRLSSGTGGTAYTMRVKCRRFFTPRPASVKGWRWAYLYADLKGSANGLISWETAAGSGSFALVPPASAVWGTGVWGTGVWGGAGNRPFRIPLSGRGPYLDFTYADDGSTGTLLSRLDVSAFDYGRRGG